jgi:hypothetical protein
LGIRQARGVYTDTTVTCNVTVDGLYTYYVVAGDTPDPVHNSDCGVTVDPRKLDYLFNKDIAADDHNTARAIQNASQLGSIGISDTPEMRAYVSAELEGAPAGGFDETFSSKYGNFGVANTVLYGSQGALGVESTWQIMDDGSYRFSRAIFRGVNSSFQGGGG